MECRDNKLKDTVRHYIKKFKNKDNLFVIQTKDGTKHFFINIDPIISKSGWIQNYIKINNDLKHIITIPVLFDDYIMKGLLERLMGVPHNFNELTPNHIIANLSWHALGLDKDKSVNNDNVIFNQLFSYLMDTRCSSKYMLYQFWATTIDVTDQTHTSPIVEYIEKLRKLITIIQGKNPSTQYLDIFETYFPRLVRSMDSIEEYNEKRYTLCKKIGGGTFGSVSLCFDNKKKRNVALKKLKKRGGGSDIKHILREINVLLHLCGHANVLHINNFYQNEKYIYIISPFHKKTLSKLIKDSKDSNTSINDNENYSHYSPPNFLTLPEIKLYVFQMLHALKWSHLKGIIHADIKPENIMYNDITNNIELIDYGSAKVYTEGFPYKFQHNADVVTVTYRAPELFSSSPYYSSSLTPKIDIWSVGIILLQMLTPKHQFNTGEDDGPFAITKERIDYYFSVEKTKRPETYRH